MCKDKCKSNKTEEELAQLRKEDREVQLWEDISTRVPEICREYGPDSEIAAQIEKELGVNADSIITEFNADHNCDYSTVELVLKAAGIYYEY